MAGLEKRGKWKSKEVGINLKLMAAESVRIKQQSHILKRPGNFMINNNICKPAH